MHGYTFITILFNFFLFLNLFILLSLLSYIMLYFLAVWSVAHTTLAVPWPVGPDTVCPLTPPRCTPSPRPAVQGQSRGQGPAQRPVDRHGQSTVANSQWEWRRLMVVMMMMMKPTTTLRDPPAFQSVGECVCEKGNTREHVWEHHQMSIKELVRLGFSSVLIFSNS